MRRGRAGKRWSERRERGQATLEYVLMLLVAVMAFLIVARAFIGPGMRRLGSVVEAQINRVLFKPGNFHRLPFGFERR